MAAFLVAALPRRIRLFAVFPTADLAGRASCDTLRAGIQRRAQPCGYCAPAFSLPRAGLSHFYLIPVASLHVLCLTKYDSNVRQSPIKWRCSTKLSYSISASRARPVGAWAFDPANATREMPFPCRYSTKLQDPVTLLPTSRHLSFCVPPLLATRTVHTTLYRLA